MFQFTREFIINDSKGKLGANHDKKYYYSAKAETLYIDNLVNLRAKDVHCAYKTPAEAAVKEVAVLDLAALDLLGNGKKGVRLVLNMGLDPEKVSAEVNDYYLNHTKEFFFEAEGADEAEIATAIEKQIARNASMNNHEMFTVEVEDKVLTLTGRDPYVRFKSVDVVDLYADRTPGEIATGYVASKRLVFADGVEGTDAAYLTQVGSVGVGTTSYIVNNVRLQTVENFNPFGSNVDERPIPGALYDQYTVELVTERRHVGHQVCGPVDTSLTTMIFFVLHNDSDCGDDPSADFEAALLNVVKEVIDEKKATLPKQVIKYTDDEEEHAGSESVSI